MSARRGGRQRPDGTPKAGLPARVAMAAEIRVAKRVMSDMGYSQADISDEVERIRRRWAVE